MKHVLTPKIWLIPQTFLLLLFFTLATTTIPQKSPTFDEQGFLVRGLGYIRGENSHMRVGHPLGLNALNALLLWGDEEVKLPTDHPSWAETSFHRPAELFLWEIGNNVAYIMFLARIMTVFVGLLLMALITRWSAELTHRPELATFALTLAVFDPNLLAHSTLVTTDLGLTAGAFISGYTLWKYLASPSWQKAILAGVGFALLNNTKFTAGLFVPLFTLLILSSWLFNFRALYQTQKPVTPFIFQLSTFIFCFPLSSFLTLWAMYGFQVGTLPQNLPMLPQLGGLTLPLAHHLEQLLDIGNRAQTGAASFLMGAYSENGWWYYFPAAFLLKTPLPTLIFLVLAFIYRLSWRTRPGLNDLALLIPPVGYFAIALTTTVNLGYRHILPILPFLLVFISYSFKHNSASPWGGLTTGRKILARLFKTSQPAPTIFWRPLPVFYAILLLILAWQTVSLTPHHLAFFNQLAGGPDHGWRYLVDSNLDWGQDLQGLKTWLEEQNITEPIWLSYFGEARPDYYGISYKGLDSFPPRLMNPAANPFYPADPAPGYYAISASNLQGVLFENHHQFAWFRDKPPLAKIGYSIFIYQVEPYGTPVNLTLSDVTMPELPAAFHAQLGTNQRHLRWFDGRTSFILPPAGGWQVSGQDSLALLGMPDLGQEWQWRANDPNQKLTLSYFPPLAKPPFTPDQALGEFTFATLYPPHQIGLTDGQIHLRTIWQATAEANRPLKIFVHALNEAGEIIGQSDVLDVVGWQVGDWFTQSHIFAVSAAPTHYRLGLYDPTTGEQLGTPVLIPAE